MIEDEDRTVVKNGSCSKSRSITRAALEARMLEGLRARSA